MNQKRKNVIILLMYACSLIVYIHQVTNSITAYISQSYPSASQATIASLLSIPSLFTFLAAFVVGPLAMRVSKKRLLLAAMACQLAHFTLMAAFGGTAPIAVLKVASALAGVAQGALSPLIRTILHETDPAHAANHIARSEAIGNLGIGAASSLGGAIAAANGGAEWRCAYLIGLVVVPLLVAAAIWLPGERKRAREQGSARGKAASRGGFPLRVVAMIAPFALMPVALCAFYYNVSNYVISEYQLGSSVQAGAAMTIKAVVGLAVGFSFPMWKQLLKKWLVPFSAAAVTVGLGVMLACTDRLWGVYAAGVLVGLASNAVPQAVATILRHTPEHYVALANALFMGTLYLGMYLAAYALDFGGRLLGGGVRGQLLTGLIVGAVTTGIFVVEFVIAEKEPAE